MNSYSELYADARRLLRTDAPLLFDRNSSVCTVFDRWRCNATWTRAAIALGVRYRTSSQCSEYQIVRHRCAADWRKDVGSLSTLRSVDWAYRWARVSAVGARIVASQSDSLSEWALGVCGGVRLPLIDDDDDVRWAVACSLAERRRGLTGALSTRSRDIDDDGRLRWAAAAVVTCRPSARVQCNVGVAFASDSAVLRLKCDVRNADVGARLSVADRCELSAHFWPRNAAYRFAAQVKLAS
jgi:hypothetical protein